MKPPFAGAAAVAKPSRNKLVKDALATINKQRLEAGRRLCWCGAAPMPICTVFRLKDGTRFCWMLPSLRLDAALVALADDLCGLYVRQKRLITVLLRYIDNAQSSWVKATVGWVVLCCCQTMTTGCGLQCLTTQDRLLVE